jgi:hypothetical protein
MASPLPGIQCHFQAGSFSTHLPLVSFTYPRLSTPQAEAQGSHGRKSKEQRSCRLPATLLPACNNLEVGSPSPPQTVAEPPLQAPPSSLTPSLGSQSRAAFDFLILPSSQQKAKCSPALGLVSVPKQREGQRRQATRSQHSKVS